MITFIVYYINNPICYLSTEKLFIDIRTFVPYDVYNIYI